MIWVPLYFKVIKIIKDRHPPAHLHHFTHFVVNIPLHYLHPLCFIITPTFVHSSGEPPDSRSIRISVTAFHSCYTYFISQAALAQNTHPLLRLMLPLLNKNPLFVSFRSYYTHAFQHCSFACPQCSSSHTAATPNLFVGCLLHCIPLRSPFCR